MTHPDILLAEADGTIHPISYDDKEQWYEVRDAKLREIEIHVQLRDGLYDDMEELIDDGQHQDYYRKLHQKSHDYAYARCGICPGCVGW